MAPITITRCDFDGFLRHLYSLRRRFPAPEDYSPHGNLEYVRYTTREELESILSFTYLCWAIANVKALIEDRDGHFINKSIDAGDTVRRDIFLKYGNSQGFICNIRTPNNTFEFTFREFLILIGVVRHNFDFSQFTTVGDAIAAKASIDAASHIRRREEVEREQQRMIQEFNFAMRQEQQQRRMHILPRRMYHRAQPILRQR